MSIGYLVFYSSDVPAHIHFQLLIWSTTPTIFVFSLPIYLFSVLISDAHHTCFYVLPNIHVSILAIKKIA